MQISKNTTSMEAGISVAVDKKGRDLCVVVIKGTFVIGNNAGQLHQKVLDLWKKACYA